MTSWGHVLLLVAFVASGYAATACIGSDPDVRRTLRRRMVAGMLGVGSLTLACGMLAYALVVKDFHFAYVAKYSDSLLPWYYSLSALWVGQAGSLLLWCWLSGVTALTFYLASRKMPPELRARAFGIQMVMVSFLTAIMIFAADPMKPSVVAISNGMGLSPVLQHPVMLIHPPIVFLGYSLWAVPFSLILAALLGSEIDAKWIRGARSWSLLAWTMLGIGILLGANWAYEELGWGGYWAWDPVENGSLIPWLTGTVFIHTMMSWQYRGVLKKTCLATGIATFGLCQFAAFLTRSGLFSSLHAFSQSAIGWLFLLLMGVIAVTGVLLIARRRSQLAPAGRIASILSREAFVSIALVALLMLVGVTITGTILTPMSGMLSQNRIVVGPQFYNNVLIPIGLVLAITTSMVPLLRWGMAPERLQKRVLTGLSTLLAGGSLAAFLFGEMHPLEILVIGLAAGTLVSVLVHLVIEISRRSNGSLRRRVISVLVAHQKQYAGFMIHAGFMMAMVGIAGSSLGALRHDVDMAEGDRIEFAGYSILYSQIQENDLLGKLAVETVVEVTADDGARFTLHPAQHYHHRQEQWTTEVAIHSTWGRDFYAIVHAGQAGSHASFSFLINPMMRWLWGAGWVCALGVAIRLSPIARGTIFPEDRSRGLTHRRNRPLSRSSRFVKV